MFLSTIFITLKQLQSKHVQVFGKLQSYLVLSNNNQNLNWFRIVGTADKCWTRAQFNQTSTLTRKSEMRQQTVRKKFDIIQDVS